MSRIADLIHQFRSEDVRLEENDKSRKPKIVEELDKFADDEIVIDFLLSIASDEAEFDLARIVAFRIFEYRQYTLQSVRTRIAEMINIVLNRDEDDYLVLQYAASAAANYMDNIKLEDTINRILHDKEKESILRGNAFFAVTCHPSTPRSSDSHSRLLADEQFSESAPRVHTEWNVD